jgi:hypothetical protein
MRHLLSTLFTLILAAGCAQYASYRAALHDRHIR